MKLTESQLRRVIKRIVSEAVLREAADPSMPTLVSSFGSSAGEGLFAGPDQFEFPDGTQFEDYSWSSTDYATALALRTQFLQKARIFQVLDPKGAGTDFSVPDYRDPGFSRKGEKPGFAAKKYYAFYKKWDDGYRKGLSYYPCTATGRFTGRGAGANISWRYDPKTKPAQNSPVTEPTQVPV